MLFNPLDPLLKRLLCTACGLVTLKQAVHNLRVGFFLVVVDGFCFDRNGL